MFSKSCEYGLRAIIYIAQQTKQDVKVSLTTISEAIDSPQAFTAKILQQLTRNNIVTSIKGPYGGFVIEIDKMKTITLSHVVKILDGDNIYTGCGLGLAQCNENSPCPLHFKFITIREQLRNMLENTSLEMLVNDMDTQHFCLKR
ncbi:Rrf2 family transcriptional regulator [Flavobacterium sp. 316]|uniref:Rrf2 family transcriptional regulator n=1 Tax=Flavobacterium sediminilitoris TaxID=2024526 RepID=A0ABY4HLB1_9FLAO|nr:MULTISPECIES: Rrf2 family transcriptional regulator [Flavobacterium]KIX22420.1 Rrf2 family transcriptional regulator [Flavobacterium sp. 316]UOX33642.1 Rrf2 family transcriptional regulator [Flavobacterium sediminilitoris]